MSSINKTVEDLADDLIELSDNFVASFKKTMETEDDYTTFLRGRERWYVGTQQNTQTGGAPPIPPAPQQAAAPQQSAPTRQRVKCPKPKNTQTTKVKQKTKGLTTGQKVALGMGIALIVGGIALALADGPQPGPADIAGLKLISMGANKIIPFVRVAVPAVTTATTGIPVAAAKGGYVTKPTKALVGEAGPELIVPMHKFGDTIKEMYKKSATALLSATAGFLGSQPNNPARGKLLGEISKLKAAFGLGALKTKGGMFGLRAPIQWWNKGRNERIPDEDNASWKELLEDDMAQRGQSDESFAKGEAPPLLGRPDQAFNPFRPAEKGGPGSGPTPAVRQAFERPVKGLMNLSQQGIAAVKGAFPRKGGALATKDAHKKKPIPVPFHTGRDMFGQNIFLNPPTEGAWMKALRAAAADGIDLPGSVTSAYRDSAEQQALIDNEDDPAVINAAPQGASPHQQGWAVDIDAGSPANMWMRENGNKFGWEWEGRTDPVHFTFNNGEDRGKYLELENSAWKPENRGRGATSMGGQVLNIVGDLIKKKLGKTTGRGYVGDPVDLENTGGSDIQPPEQGAAAASVNETPVTQSEKQKVGAVGVPVVIPGVTKVIQGAPQVEKLDPDVMRNIVIDGFNKGIRVEVAYV